MDDSAALPVTEGSSAGRRCGGATTRLPTRLPLLVARPPPPPLKRGGRRPSLTSSWATPPP
eukprot:10700931-Lingulodinium_polyedra.AAC.1